MLSTAQTALASEERGQETMSSLTVATANPKQEYGSKRLVQTQS